jgi:hypothetical protein
MKQQNTTKPKVVAYELARQNARQKPPRNEMEMKGNNSSSLSPCAQMYAMSLANPFADGPDGACIPDAPALMTRRTKVWTKGTFSTSSDPGALGTGYIIIDPLSGIAGDRTWVYSNSVNRNGITINISTAGQFVGFSSNSDYVTADLSPANYQCRLVSVGLKIRNITSILNKGGFIIGLHEPAHSSLVGQQIATMDLYLEAGDHLVATSEEWSVLTYRPVDTNDLDWRSAFPVLGGPGSSDNTYMAFMVQSPTIAGTQLYEFEAFANFEVQGARAIGKRPSHADPTGYAAVNSMTVFAKKLHSPHQENPVELSQHFVKASDWYMDHHMSDSRKSHEEKKKSGGSSIWSDILGIVPDVIGGIASLF